MVLNDEAHHCYREKPRDQVEERALKGSDRKEATQTKKLRGFGSLAWNRSKDRSVSNG